MLWSVLVVSLSETFTSRNNLVVLFLLLHIVAFHCFNKPCDSSLSFYLMDDDKNLWDSLFLITASFQPMKCLSPSWVTVWYYYWCTKIEQQLGYQIRNRQKLSPVCNNSATHFYHSTIIVLLGWIQYLFKEGLCSCADLVQVRCFTSMAWLSWSSKPKALYVIQLITNTTSRL